MHIPLIRMDVAIKTEKGPAAPRISLRGRISKLRIKIPSGGIQAVRKMEAICVEPLHTY